MFEAREELFGILESDEMRGVPVVVVANKQDLPGKSIVFLSKTVSRTIFLWQRGRQTDRQTDRQTERHR